MATTSELEADCGRCFGLCCVALAFARSADFAFDKAAGDPCENLGDDYRCEIHPQLRERGFKGCTVFDCFGAGQKVSQQTFGGQSWLGMPGVRSEMFEVFPVVRQLHELLWYLDAAGRMPGAEALRPQVHELAELTEAMTGLGAAGIRSLDVHGQQARVGELLGRVSAAVRSGRGVALRAGVGAGGAAVVLGGAGAGVGRAAAAGVPGVAQLGGADAGVGGTAGAGVGRAAGAGLAGVAKKWRRQVCAGGDLMGADLAGADLRGADLRGAYLIAASMAGCDLGWVDLLGADLRDADLSGARLGEALFLTQVQVNAARGDAATGLPAGLSRPGHWVGVAAAG